MGGSRCVQNVPTGCGNNLVMILGNQASGKNMHMLIQCLYMAIVCSNLRCFYIWSKILQAKWLDQPWDNFMISMKEWLWHCIYQSDPWFSCKTYFLDCLYNYVIYLYAIYYIYISLYMSTQYIYIFIYIYTNLYVRHWSLHLVSHPGLQSTPLDARRDGNVSAADFNKNYDTRIKIWPLVCQNVIFSDKNDEPSPPMIMFLYQAWPWIYPTWPGICPTQPDVEFHKESSDFHKKTIEFLWKSLLWVAGICPTRPGICPTWPRICPTEWCQEPHPRLHIHTRRGLGWRELNKLSLINGISLIRYQASGYVLAGKSSLQDDDCCRVWHCQFPMDSNIH